MQYIVIVQKDGDGFLAQVQEQENLFARWQTQEAALQELDHVIDMMIEYHQAKAHEQQNIKKSLHKKLNIHAL